MKEKNRKKALCYAGLPPLDFSAAEVFFQKTDIEPSDTDLFCCFWKVGADEKKIEKFAKKFNRAHISFIDLHFPNVLLPEYYLKFPETKVDRVLSMFFIRARLLEEIIPRRSLYDYYVFTRPDVYISKEIKIDDLFRDFSKSCNIYIPNAGNYRNGFTDTLAVADYFGISAYLSAFNRLKKILGARVQYSPPKSAIDFIKESYAFFDLLVTGRINYVANWTPLHPENIIRKNMELSGLNVGFFDVGEIVIKRNNMLSYLSNVSNTPSFMQARYLLKESIDDIYSRINRHSE